MSAFELYVSHSTLFGGWQKPFDKADYVVVGVPFDATSSYRRGARYAPLAIRLASLNIESFSFSSGIDMEDLNIHDLGDLHTSSNTEITLKNLELTARDLIEIGKTPVLLGGEHTITLGAMRALGGKNTAIINLDAHLDLRHEHLGETTSHTSFMRRLKEQVKPSQIVEVGTRAVCKEELSFAKQAGIQYFTMKEIQRRGIEATAKLVMKTIENCKKIYLTIDFDVLDPAFAPAVQNPEPNGLSTQSMFALVSCLCDKRLAGLDLVEVTPSYDQGVTAIQAAKLLFEVLCFSEKSRRN